MEFLVLIHPSPSTFPGRRAGARRRAPLPRV